MTSSQDDILQTFLSEAQEHLESADHGLIALEKDPTDAAIVSQIFRAVHSIKGSSGFFGFKSLESITHAGESLLNAVRDGKVYASTEVISALLGVADAIRAIVDHIVSQGTEGHERYQDLVKTLNDLRESQAGATPTKPSVVAPPPAQTAPPSDVGFVIFADEQTTPPAPKSEAKVEAKLAVEPPPKDLSPEIDKAKVPRKSEGESTIRVSVQVLGRLMDLVGELVLSRNEVTQVSLSHKIAPLISPCQRLSRITTELQEQILKTRMQPVSILFGPFQRIVRDLSLVCGKKIELVLQGQETELDKSLLEAIKDPLNHLVRNAVDHGFERPEERQKAGKSPAGTLTIRALSRSGSVLVEITDDGRGIDPARIKAKALDKGIISETDSLTLPDQEAIKLIFAPGFSTAEKVTNISGRGVGMDVVKTNVEKIGGTVEIESAKGLGTTMRLKIPLTLAIIPALIVHAKSHQFAIPQASLLELVRLTSAKTVQNIDTVDGHLVYRLRGRLLPLVHLHDLAGLERNKEAPFDSHHGIVVLSTHDTSFGLIVDHIRDTQEIVVKPLSEHLRGIPVYGGATILGNGSLALILNVEGVAERAQLAATRKAFEHPPSAVDTRVGQYVIVQTPGPGRMAIPIKDVIRIEKIPVKTLENLGHDLALNYRQKVLPLKYLNGYLVERRKKIREIDKTSGFDSVPIIVMQCNMDKIGLIVDAIVDIVEHPLDSLGKPSRPYVLGTSIVKERITEFLDVDAVMVQIGSELGGRGDRRVSA